MFKEFVDFYAMEVGCLSSKILAKVEKYLITTVTFTKMWPGHYLYYSVEGELTGRITYSKWRKEIGKDFNIIGIGWNKHPFIFERK